MKRSVWKLPYIHNVFFKKRLIFKKRINFVMRNSIIPRTFLDKRLSIYNGAWSLSRNVITSTVGLKLGEIAFTKRSDRQTHTKTKSKKKSKKNKK